MRLSKRILVEALHDLAYKASGRPMHNGLTSFRVDLYAVLMYYVGVLAFTPLISTGCRSRLLVHAANRIHTRNMSAVALTFGADFAELKEKAGEVGRIKDLPFEFQKATKYIRAFTELASQWERLDVPMRNLLHWLALEVAEDKHMSWLRRQKVAWQFARLASRGGAELVMRQADLLLKARDEFVSTVLCLVERNNGDLQAELAAAITSSSESTSREQLSTREQVGDWFKRLPS
jgi:hypothetical protein